MPLPQYRLLPFPQLSLLTIPAAVTLPFPLGSLKGFGDIRFVDLAVLDPGHSLLFGVGPTFVFPTASDPATGQGKWQGRARSGRSVHTAQLAVRSASAKSCLICGRCDSPGHERLVSSPVHHLSARPWLVRQIRAADDLRLADKQAADCQSMLELAGSSKLAHNTSNYFVEPAWNVSGDGPAPRYAITFGLSLLYPNLWSSLAR